MAESDLKAAIVTAVDAIDKAMGELTAASVNQVVSPFGAATKTAHVIPPDALYGGDAKVRAATQKLKDAVAATNGRMAGDPSWNLQAVAYPTPAAKPGVAAKPSIFARATAPKAPARPSWPGR
jgi:hypothetical protein